jgi:hypothetical protein
VCTNEKGRRETALALNEEKLLSGINNFLLSCHGRILQQTLNASVSMRFDLSATALFPMANTFFLRFCG